MKLVIFGLTISSSWGNGHATLWRGLCRALAERGHEIVFYERDVPYYAEFRDLAEMPGGGELRLYADWESIRHEARLHLDEADVGIVTSYCPDGIAATQLVVESRVPLTAFYDLDTPVTLERLDAGQEVAYIGPRGLGDFDVVLSYTGGKAIDRLQEKLGAREVKTLYGSVDPDVHCPAEPKSWFETDLSYLGTYAEDRQETLVELFVEPARRLPDMRFLIGGTQYPDSFPWADNIYFVRHVDPPQHPAFYSSSRLTLNVTRRAMKSMGYCPSGRLFEAAACGTPLLSDVWEGLEEFFEPGAELLVATTREEVVSALNMPADALAQIGRRARERTLDEHTAGCRARQLETILEEASTGAARRPAGKTPRSLAEVR